MKEEENDVQVVSDDHSFVDAVMDHHEFLNPKPKKKKDNNRAKWKLRKEMKKQQEILASQTEDIIKDYIDIDSKEIIKPYIEVKHDVIRDYLDIGLDSDVNSIQIESQDIVKEYLDVDSKIDSFEKPSVIENNQLNVQQAIPTPMNEEIPKVQSNTNAYDIRRIYIGFQTRVTLLVLGILLLFGVACYLIISTLQQYEVKKVKYFENSDIHYKVCKSASSVCMKENQMYLAKDISTVNIDYQYDAQFETDVPYNFTYYVIAVHSIYDRYDSSKISYEQEEIIKTEEKLQGVGDNAHIDVSAEINFLDYHSFVNNYKKKYSDISHSDLSVRLYVNDGSSAHLVGEVLIPLASEKFGIVANPVDYQQQSYNHRSSRWSQSSATSILIGCALVIISLAMLFRLTRLVLALSGKKSKYQQTLRMILNEYDRLIVNAQDRYEVSPNKKLTKVTSFDELLEIRSTINKPIIFSHINNVKSEFVVEDEENVYKYVLKEADMGE